MASSKQPTVSNDSNRLRAQSRSDLTKRQSDKHKADMQTVMQQHLIGPSIVHSNNNDKELRDKSGSKEEGGKKGRLQTVGSVLGDIIGVLISEVARFFGSVVSDVAREVTAHGFVSLLKQIADFTGISNGASAASAAATAAVAGTPPHVPAFA